MDAADPIIIENLSGTIIDMNREAEREYGWKHREHIGKSIRSLIPSTSPRYGHLKKRILNVEWGLSPLLCPKSHIFSAVTAKAGFDVIVVLFDSPSMFLRIALQISRTAVVTGLIFVMQTGMLRPLGSLLTKFTLRDSCAGFPFNGPGLFRFFTSRFFLGVHIIFCLLRR